MNVIDTSNWKDFLIGDLFEVSRPVARSAINYVSGETPFVASGNFNNGVADYFEPHPDETLDAGNCITVSPLDGSAFYQPSDFLGRGGAGSAIIMLRNSKLVQYSGLFIAAVIRKTLTRFNYSDQLNKDLIAQQKIKLPATATGNPDWSFMEDAMKDQLIKQESKLDILSSIDVVVLMEDMP